MVEWECCKCGHVQSGAPTTSAGGKTLNPLQRVVCAYKIAKGFKKDDAAWDRNNWPRCSREGKRLLERFAGNVERSVAFLLITASELQDKGLSWNLNTIANRAWDMEVPFDGYEHGALDAGDKLESGGPDRIAQQGGEAPSSTSAGGGGGQEGTGLA